MEKKSGVNRIVSAMANSFRGLSFLIKEEAAFRQEVVLSAVLIPSAFWVGETAIEIVLLILPVGLILIVEALNTALHGNAFAYFASEMITRFAGSQGITENEIEEWRSQLIQSEKDGRFGFVSMPVLTTAVAKS